MVHFRNIQGNSPCIRDTLLPHFGSVLERTEDFSTAGHSTMAYPTFSLHGNIRPDVVLKIFSRSWMGLANRDKRQWGCVYISWASPAWIALDCCVLPYRGATASVNWQLSSIVSGSCNCPFLCPFRPRGSNGILLVLIPANHTMPHCFLILYSYICKWFFY